jgi:hypothetical protein
VLERGVDDGFRDVLLLAGPASVEFDAAARSARFTVADGGFAAWIDVAAARRAGTVRTGLRVALAADGDVLDLRARAFRDASRVRLEEAAVERAAARLAAHLAPAVGPARVLGQRATADEGTVLTPRGGIAGLRLDVMLRAP